jgi:hypothetical protein
VQLIHDIKNRINKINSVLQNIRLGSQAKHEVLTPKVLDPESYEMTTVSKYQERIINKGQS